MLHCSELRLLYPHTKPLSNPQFHGKCTYQPTHQDRIAAALVVMKIRRTPIRQRRRKKMSPAQVQRMSCWCCLGLTVAWPDVRCGSLGCLPLLVFVFLRHKLILCIYRKYSGFGLIATYYSFFWLRGIFSKSASTRRGVYCPSIVVNAYSS